MSNLKVIDLVILKLLLLNTAKLSHVILLMPFFKKKLRDYIQIVSVNMHVTQTDRQTFDKNSALHHLLC